MQTQAEAAITQGASVLLVDALDSGSGAAIEANAASKGVKVIDYDRLTKGGSPDRIYVSFDNVKVGQLIGQGEIDCINEWKVANPNVLIMNGDPTDNNASQFAEGYNGVLKPLFDNNTYVKVGEPAGHVDPVGGGHHVPAAAHRPPGHQRRRHAQRRQRQRRDRGAPVAERAGQDVPHHRPGRVPLRACRTSSRATSAAPSTSRSTWRPRPRPPSPSTSGPARRRPRP